MAVTDRSDAGKRLTAALEGYRDERPVVLAPPRGSVPVAAVIAATVLAKAALDEIIVTDTVAPTRTDHEPFRNSW